MDEKPLSRRYSPGDEYTIVEILETVFEGWPSFDIECSNMDFWEWKYQDNYTEKLVTVTQLDNQIVGCIHTVPLMVKIFDQIHLCGIGGDVAVLKEYRRRGVRNSFFSLMAEMRKAAGISVIYAITRNPIVIEMFERRPTHKKLPIELVHYLRIRDYDLHFKMNPSKNALIRKRGYQAISTLRSTRYAMTKNVRESSVTVSMVEKLDDNADVFWEQVSNGYDLKTVTDSKYLNWRYGDPRSGDFKIYLTYDEENVVGYLVLRVNKSREEYSVGFIVDLLSFDDRVDVVDALLAKAMMYFDENDVNIVNFLAVKGYKFDNSLMKYGFFDSRWNHSIYYHQPLGVDVLETVVSSGSERIHFCFGDLDYI
jgi:hypothetical protein